MPIARCCSLLLDPHHKRRAGRRQRDFRPPPRTVALAFSVAAWGWFIAFGAIGAKAAALAMEYAVFRLIVRQRLRSAPPAALDGSYSPSVAE